jgi:stage IV sporulation protein B
MPFLQAAPAVPAGSAAPAGVTAADKSANVTLTLLGLPVKTVRTVQQQRRTVHLGGTPFGVKMFTDGALVVAFSDIYTVHGSENPAKEAGLRLGDLITQANGIPVRTNEELTDAIAAAAGGSVELRYLHPYPGQRARHRCPAGGHLGAGFFGGHWHFDLCGYRTRDVCRAGARGFGQ